MASNRGENITQAASEAQEARDHRENVGADAPNGFRLINDGGNRLWFSVEEGNVLQGRMIGRFPRKDDPTKFFYQIKATYPCPVRDSEKNEFDAKAGDIVIVDERATLTDLAKVQADVEVWIKVGPKQINKKKQEYWTFAIAARGADLDKRPLNHAALAHQGNDIPF